MWYFSWILGLGLACTFGILNAMWFEMREDRAAQHEVSSDKPWAHGSHEPERPGAALAAPGFSMEINELPHPASGFSVLWKSRKEGLHFASLALGA